MENVLSLGFALLIQTKNTKCLS